MSSNGVRKPAYFKRGDSHDEFIPLDRVRSGWSNTQMTGPAATGILALVANEYNGEVSPGRTLVRVSYDLHSVPKLVPTRVRTDLVKQGRRVTLIDVFLEQDGRDVGRAHCYFARSPEFGENVIWTSAPTLPPPPVGSIGDVQGRQYFTEETGWINRGSMIPPVSQKAVWVEGIELIEGATPSGVELAGFAADSLNPVVSWGERGIQHINMDSTMSLTRQPRSDGIGISVMSVVESAGILAGSGAVFDRDGALGTVSIVSIAQRKTVDPSHWVPLGESRSP